MTLIQKKNLCTNKSIRIATQYSTTNLCAEHSPLLAMYTNELVTSHMGFAKFSELVSLDNEMKLLEFLADTGLLAKYHQFEYCGGQMRKSKQ